MGPRFTFTTCRGSKKATRSSDASQCGVSLSISLDLMTQRLPGGSRDSGHGPSPAPRSGVSSRHPSDALCSRLRGRGLRCLFCPPCCRDSHLPSQQLRDVCPSVRLPSYLSLAPDKLYINAEQFEQTLTVAFGRGLGSSAKTFCLLFRRTNIPGHLGHARHRVPRGGWVSTVPAVN